VLLVKKTAAQLIKKCPSFYETWRFITIFTLLIILSQMNPIHLDLCLPSGLFFPEGFLLIWAQTSHVISSQKTESVHTACTESSCGRNVTSILYIKKKDNYQRQPSFASITIFGWKTTQFGESAHS
jgi:hypothetical protein